MLFRSPHPSLSLILPHPCLSLPFSHTIVTGYSGGFPGRPWYLFVCFHRDSLCFLTACFSPFRREARPGGGLGGVPAPRVPGAPAGVQGKSPPNPRGVLRKSSSPKEECSVLPSTQHTQSDWERFPGLDVS